MSSNDNPWRTLDIREVFDNPWIRVTAEDVIKPNGAPAVYGKVGFKQIACGIIPIADNGDTWLVGQYRYTLDQYSWEIPMGGVPRHEDTLAGAQRELKEETGLTAKHWERILDCHVSNSVTDEAGCVFIAQELTEGEPEPDDSEDLQIRRLPLRDAVAMAMSGEITCLLSMAGLIKLAAIRKP
jgi:8-oxo-dGTP pyrophosphatase MutT (NUDIX family)